MSNQDITQTTNEMIFNFKGNELAAITDENGDPWFVAKHVADLLGYKNSSRDIHRHCKSLKMLKSTESVLLDVPPRGLVIIPERDVYRLVMRSNMPEAEKFEEWVVGEVLPSIRKTGGYQVPVTREQELAKSFLLATEVIEEQKSMIQEQTKKIEEDAPKVEYYEKAGNAKGLMTITDAVKRMNLKIGRNKAFEKMRSEGVLQSSKSSWNQPYQTFIDRGYFVVKQKILFNDTSAPVTLVTSKGHQWLFETLK